jgi:beta-barrel assembly-enhancing protease
MGNGFSKGRIIIALIIAAISVFTYYRTSVRNPVTGEKQHIDMTPQQEIALGLQAAPRMAQEFGGLDPSEHNRAVVEQTGEGIVAKSAAGKTPYQFGFHALADDRTVNAFALPGGQIFITHALLKRLKSRGQLAGVLGHEVGHVVARHSAEQMAKARLQQGLAGAAVVATYDPGNPASRNSAYVAQMVTQMMQMKYGRDDELEADKLGVRFMADSGYDPRAMIEVMKILASATGGGRQPEFFSTHPNPENRIARIQQAIKAEFPNGVPAGLVP